MILRLFCMGRFHKKDGAFDFRAANKFESRDEWLVTCD